MANIDALRCGLTTAYIDAELGADPNYVPQFVYNDSKNGKKVIASLEDELRHCDFFAISVAFINLRGITPLLQVFKDLEKRGIRGRIITTDYLTFTEPRALEKLATLTNIELKIYKTDGADEGFHTKGYIFKRDDEYRFIVGSSNLTNAALTKNKEWNTRHVSTSDGEMVRDILSEYDRMWNAPEAFAYADIIEEYRRRYEEEQLLKKLVKDQKKLVKASKMPSIRAYRLQPNSMQVGFINNLKKMVEEGADKALLISATGTGKTYAAAFAMRELGFERVLFLVHRNRIAKQAKESFETVFSNTIRTGLVSGIAGSDDDYDADYVFATVQTVSRPDNLRRFDTRQFDAIIYDEAHHTSANTYKRIMEYFKPRFTLGMTATPDKRDDNIEGRNIYDIFDHKIAYEIRLQQAMEDDLLCPFHYFGITDLATITDEGKSQEEKLENFKYLTSDARVDYVMEQANYYGYSGSRVKGLMFCSRVEEAYELSKKFNAKGLRTVALSGRDSEEVRENAIELLTKDMVTDEDGHVIPGQDYLDYIITVDIFSEGTDIVEVNQVIMLRPTQSPIVFVQQLGRGLRKWEDKEYVVVLDFIGNYTNNYMIPIALSGDRTYNKDNVRRYVLEGGRVIPGESTLHFDDVSRTRIFEAIDNANFSDLKLIKENYTNLKNKLGRIPALADFDKYGEMDVLRIFDNNNLGSYYKFLKKYEKEYTVRLSEKEEQVIEFISKKLANGKRVEELELLKICLSYQHGIIGLFASKMQDVYGRDVSKLQMRNIINVLTNEFPTGSGKNTYKNCVFLQEETALADRDERIKAYVENLLGINLEYRVSDDFASMLGNSEFYNILLELLEFGIARYNKNYSNRYAETNLVLYQKYTYEDVCRLLNWEHSEVSLNIGGYKYDKTTKTFPVFINYDKDDDISDTTRYEDRFLSNNRLISISKSGRSVMSDDVQNFIHAKERGIDVQLFVRKNKDDRISKEFYYLGRMTATGDTREFTMANTTKTAVEMEWKLDVPVREDIYEYIVNS
ncbi:MAG: DEAD/DEAH box helicase [Lachnospiraceae bacterium]|nr:DEAD/DEAH box helicase [Lachnospiraceae bacterium]